MTRMGRIPRIKRSSQSEIPPAKIRAIRLIRVIRDLLSSEFFSLSESVTLVPCENEPSCDSDLKSKIKNRKSKILDMAAGLMVCCLAMPVVTLSIESVHTAAKKSGYPYRESAQEWMDMGKWLRENAPSDSITMTRNPWELHFYSEQLATQIPRASLEKTIEVMRFYKPTYIIPQLDIRPSLKPLVEGEVPGLELVYDNKKLKLYRIHYDLLPGSENLLEVE